MPRMQFLNIERLNYIARAVATDKHDLEDTVMCALTHREVAIVVGGIVLMDLVFPEYDGYTSELMGKIQDITKGLNFFEV